LEGCWVKKEKLGTAAPPTAADPGSAGARGFAKSKRRVEIRKTNRVAQLQVLRAMEL